MQNLISKKKNTSKAVKWFLKKNHFVILNSTKVLILLLEKVDILVNQPCLGLTKANVL